MCSQEIMGIRYSVTLCGKEVIQALVMVGVASNIKINRPPHVFPVHQQDEKPDINLHGLSYFTQLYATSKWTCHNNYSQI